MPIGAAQFVAQGSALRLLVDCDGSLQSSASQPFDSTDSQSATDGRGTGPRQKLSNGAIHSTSVGAGQSNGSSKQRRVSEEQDSRNDKPSVGAAVPNGVHNAVASSLSHHSSQQTAGQLRSPPGETLVEGEMQKAELPGHLLGTHPNAAAASDPGLPGTGPLLPAWRNLAAAMAPVLHPVRPLSAA